MSPSIQRPLSPSLLIGDIPRDLYCHLVGYQNRKLSDKNVSQSLPFDSSRTVQQLKMNGPASVGMVSVDMGIVALSAPMSPTVMSPHKRKRDIHSSVLEHCKSDTVRDAIKDGPCGFLKSKVKVGDIVIRKQTQVSEALKQENTRLRKLCLEYEETETQMLLKEQKLVSELKEAEEIYKRLSADLKLMDTIKTEKP